MHTCVFNFMVFSAASVSIIWHVLCPNDELGSSVSIVTGYRLGDRGSIPDWGRGFFLASVSRPAVGPNQSPVQWIPGGFFPWGRVWLGCAADHSHPSNAKFKKVWELYLLSPQAPPWQVVGQLLLWPNSHMFSKSFPLVIFWTWCCEITSLTLW
jgi:hypothetical protein